MAVDDRQACDIFVWVQGCIDFTQGHCIPVFFNHLSIHVARVRMWFIRNTLRVFLQNRYKSRLWVMDELIRLEVWTLGIQLWWSNSRLCFLADMLKMFSYLDSCRRRNHIYCFGQIPISTKWRSITEDKLKSHDRSQNFDRGSPVKTHKTTKTDSIHHCPISLT